LLNNPQDHLSCGSYCNQKLIELKFDTLVARQYIDQANLPQADPFDTALVAQAIAKHMTLVTSDHLILESKVTGLHYIDAKK
jgi:PIN domain nuclease of toxin-antitoxin system